MRALEGGAGSACARRGRAAGARGASARSRASRHCSSPPSRTPKAWSFCSPSPSRHDKASGALRSFDVSSLLPPPPLSLTPRHHFATARRLHCAAIFVRWPCPPAEAAVTASLLPPPPPPSAGVTGHPAGACRGPVDGTCELPTICRPGGGLHVFSLQERTVPQPPVAIHTLTFVTTRTLRALTAKGSMPARGALVRGWNRL